MIFQAAYCSGFGLEIVISVQKRHKVQFWTSSSVHTLADKIKKLAALTAGLQADHSDCKFVYSYGLVTPNIVFQSSTDIDIWFIINFLRSQWLIFVLTVEMFVPVTQDRAAYHGKG